MTILSIWENLCNGQYRTLALDLPEGFIDLSVSRDFVYLLFENEVHLYRY